MRHTEQGTPMEIIFRAPGKRPQSFAVSPLLAREMHRLLKQKLAAMERDDAWIPAEAVLPELKDPVRRAAAYLRGARYRKNLTQRQLAKKIGILPHHLSEMEHGKRPIGKAMAKKLGIVLKADWRMFL